MSPTVLLVDQHEDSVAVYTILLEHHGYRVLSAGRWQDAVRLARERRPDVVVLAYTAVRRQGVEAVRALAQHESTTGVPLIALSTSVQPSDRDAALAAGCAGYLLKPCPPMDLLAEVRRVVGERA